MIKKYFTHEVKIGLVGVIALICLFFGIKFLKGANLFSSSKIYYIEFRNAKALAKSSAVYADGYNVGTVSDIIYDYNKPGKVIVEISVSPDMRIPKGSSATLEEAMLGGCTLNILMANNPRECYEAGDTIIGEDAGGLMSQAADLMPQVKEIMKKVDTLMVSLNNLAGDPNLPIIIQNAEQMTENLNQSTQHLNNILGKNIPQMTTTFNQAGENVVTLTNNLNQLDLQATLASVDATIQNVNLMTQRLNSTDNSLGLLLNDTTLYHNLNSTVADADSLVIDLKAHPKRYVHFSVFGGKQ